jgi:DNA-binding transcriptional LysR family regulator
VARRLVKQDRVICASPAYLRAHGEPQTLAEVHAHRCVVGSIKGPPMVWFVSIGGVAKRYTPPATHRLSDGEAMVDAAIGGLGIAQLPASLVRRAIADGSLRPILQASSAIGVDVNAVWPRQRHLNPRVRYVVDRLVEYSALGRLD